MRLLLLIPVLFITVACASKPRVYQPPSPARLNASTERVSGAVTKAHENANKAKDKVDEAISTAKKIKEETLQLESVPVTLVEKVNDLELQLDEARQAQASLEVNLREANTAKAEVEKDKAEYFKAAQSLADQASKREVKAAESINRYHRLKLWLCLAISAAVGLIVWQFKVLFIGFGPYGIAAAAALPIAAFSACWLLL